MQQTEEYIKDPDFEGVGEEGGSSFRSKILNKTEGFLDSPYWAITLIVLVGCISFLLGRISKIGEEREPVRVISDNISTLNNPPSPLYIKGGTEEKITELKTNQTASVEVSGVDNSTQVKVVGSKNGTKYHLESCPGAKQISEKNKIVFESIEEARSRGYTPASNCKGLQ